MPRIALPFVGSLAIIVFSESGGWAQDAAHAPTRPPLPPLQVIEGIQIEKDGRTITYQRVVPPVLLPKAPASVPPAEPPTAYALTAEQQRRAAKQSGTLLLMAAVHEHCVTELRWRQQGRELRAYSNIDFNQLAGVSEIETAETIYTLLLGVSDLTAADLEAFNRSVKERGLPTALMKQVPPLKRFPTDRSGYVMAEVPAFPEATALLDALHTYYDANRQMLAEQTAKREAEQAAREQWLKEHPPAPKDTVIQFWPVKSRNYPTPKN